MWSVLLILGIHLLLLVNGKPVLPGLLDTLLASMEPWKAWHLNHQKVERHSLCSSSNKCTLENVLLPLLAPPVSSHFINSNHLSSVTLYISTIQLPLVTVYLSTVIPCIQTILQSVPLLMLCFNIVLINIDCTTFNQPFHKLLQSDG